MKLKGIKSDGKIYFFSEKKIQEHGSVEKALKAHLDAKKVQEVAPPKEKEKTKETKTETK